MKYVIIGVGAAGITAAKTIRKERSQDEIVMLSADDMVYSRCMLHKFIGGERDVTELSFIQPDFFKDNRITWRKNVTVTGVDTAKKSVIFNGGSESYDTLLIATGGKSIFPPIEGLKEASTVYGLRDFSDAKAIRDKAASAKNIVVIGAGLVGLDATYGLIEMGKKPVVIDFAETLLSANLDANAASVYQSKFEEAGCVFKLGRKVSSVHWNKDETVSAVTMDNGEKLPCDLLIVAAGIRPAIGFLTNSNIACKGGITVNEYMATSVEGVFAAGDVAGLSQSWPAAVKQGETAGFNMCGIVTKYDEILSLKNTVNFFGIHSLSVGQFLPKEGDVTYSREDRKVYNKLIVRDGIPVGVILQGDISRSGFWQQLIINKINITSIPKPVWKVSFADSYSIDDNGEYKWVV